MVSRIVCVVLLCAAAGCVTTSRLGDFTAVANFSIQAPEPIERGVTGEDCLIQFQLGQVPSIETAVDNAVRSVPGANALVNVEINLETTPYGGVLWPRICYKVRGDAIKLERLS